MLWELFTDEKFIHLIFDDNRGVILKKILKTFINSHINSKNCFTNELIFILIRSLIRFGKNFNMISLFLCEFIL